MDSLTSVPSSEGTGSRGRPGPLFQELMVALCGVSGQAMAVAPTISMKLLEASKGNTCPQPAVRWIWSPHCLNWGHSDQQNPTFLESLFLWAGITGS